MNEEVSGIANVAQRHQSQDFADNFLLRSNYIVFLLVINQDTGNSEVVQPLFT